jgi:hypothetical protein
LPKSHLYASDAAACRKENKTEQNKTKTRKEKTTPFGVNLMLLHVLSTGLDE